MVKSRALRDSQTQNFAGADLFSHGSQLPSWLLTTPSLVEVRRRTAAGTSSNLPQKAYDSRDYYQLWTFWTSWIKILLDRDISLSWHCRVAPDLVISLFNVWMAFYVGMTSSWDGCVRSRLPGVHFTHPTLIWRSISDLCACCRLERGYHLAGGSLSSDWHRGTSERTSFNLYFFSDSRYERSLNLKGLRC